MSEANPTLLASLAITRQGIKGLPVDEILASSVKDHYEHLMQLAERLRNCGFDDTTIDSHVIGIFENYKAQLLETIASAMADRTQ